MKSDCTAADGPTKTVDYSDHRVKRVEKAPLFRDDLAAKAHGGDEESELHNKGNHIADVSKLGVESGQEKTGTKRSKKGQDCENGKSD